jgi:hypothetical protein
MARDKTDVPMLYRIRRFALDNEPIKTEMARRSPIGNKSV